MPDGAQELSGRGRRWQLVEELVDRPEPDREVVAVVAVAEHRVEPGQRRGVAVDRPPRTPEAGAQAFGIDRGAVLTGGRHGAGGAGHAVLDAGALSDHGARVPECRPGWAAGSIAHGHRITTGVAFIADPCRILLAS